MPAAPATDRQRLLDVILGSSVEEFVRSRRAQKPKRPWRLIERDLFAATGEDVTYETLRSWFPDRAGQPKAEERSA